MSALTVSNISNDLLQAVSLQVQPGTCLTISGPSGSGKSLLLRAIADLDPHEGKLSVDDSDSQSVSGPEWRTQVMLVPAESQWWYDTVGEHFPSTENIDFAALGFSDEVRDWHIDRLSTGERQRLGLLRALALQPKVLLLDEPTAALDAESRLMVESLIQDYKDKHQAAIIWVSHDREQIQRISNHHKLMDNGCLKEEGPAL